MASDKFKSSLRQYLQEFLIPIDEEAINLKKNRTAAIVKFAFIIPTIYLLTFLTLFTYRKNPYDQTASSILFWLWIILFLVYAGLNSIILKTGNLRVSRLLTFSCIFLELCSNQVCIYATGSLTSHAVLFLPICICLYRIFFDYYTSLFCTIACSALYTATAILELCRFVPISPYLSSPVQYQAYSDLLMACSFVFAVVLGVFITFFTVNFSMNQTLKLNRYIMNNWKNDLSSLHEFSQNVALAADIDDITTLTFKAIIQTKSFDMAAFMIFNDKNELQLKSSFGWKHEWEDKYTENPLTRESPVTRYFFEKSILLTIEDMDKFPDLRKTIGEIPLKSIYAYPLSFDKSEYGLFLIANTESRNVSEHHMQILSSITGQAGIALQNLTTLSKEIMKASLDGLTGLYNRRHFDEQLSASVNKAFANNSQLSLIMLDIDNFKKYNDTYGHPAGDQLLRVLAETVSKCIRSKDIAARYGGEEFAVILKDAGIEAALSIAERIRKSIENIPPDKLESRVTSSIGVGTLQNCCKDAQMLISAADQSLYHAKRSGKNKVCCISVAE